MASCEHLDMLIGEALENMVKAAKEIKSVLPKSEKAQYNIREAMDDLWIIREEIYRLHPYLQKDFEKEYVENKDRFEKLQEICNKASSAEDNGQKLIAKGLFLELLTSSRYGHFKRLAEAGLYRTSITESGSDFNNSEMK